VSCGRAGVGGDLVPVSPNVDGALGVTRRSRCQDIGPLAGLAWPKADS
jgi:hypothetical protein